MNASKTHGAVIVTRVSTGEQAKHGTSLASQLETCRIKAESLRLPIVAEYEDAGISGTFLATRGGMQGAIADIQAGRADTLICASMSRYSRDAEHQASILKAVRGAGGTVILCDMDFADSPEGDLAFGIFGNFAEYERKVLRARSEKGHLARANAGIQTARVSSPYGYHIPTTTDVLSGKYPPELRGKYLIVEDEAERVRHMFACYAAGTHSINQLAKDLNTAGIPTPGGGKVWCNTNIRYILMNPVYKGVAVFGRFDHTTDEGRIGQPHWRTGKPMTSPKVQRNADPSTWITMPCPALVSDEQWNAVQAKLKDNKAQKGGNPARVKMLAGRVFCKKCDAGMYCMAPCKHKSTKPGSTEVYIYGNRYICGRNRTTQINTGNGECTPAGFYVQKIEAAMLMGLLAACEKPEAVQAALKAYAENISAHVVSADPRRELAALDKAIADTKTDEAALVQAQVAGIRAGASPDAYADAFATLAARRKDMEDRRGVLQHSMHNPARKPSNAPAKGIQAILADVYRVLSSPLLSGSEKRDVVGTVIEKVYCLRGDDGQEAAEVVFLPGLFFGDTVQTSSEAPDIRRLRAGKRHGSGFVPSGNSEATAPPPSAISANKRRLSAG